MLTSHDVNELSWWFSEPAPVYAAGRLGAQSYDPRGSDVYDPTTDYRLEGMVTAALRSHRSEWSRVKRILDALTPAHREILRRAFSPLPALALSGFRFPEVAVVTQAAVARAGELAMQEEHTRLLEVAARDAQCNACSPMTIAIRVLEADRRVLEHGILVTEDMVRTTLRRMLERAVKNDDTDTLLPVRLEMQRLVDEAGDAYRAARAATGATRKQDKAAQRKKAEQYLDEQLGKKRRKETARFEAKLQRAS